MPPHYRLSPSLGSLPLLHHFSEPNHLSRNGCLASCRNQTRNASITNASAERATKSLQKVPTQMSYKSRQKNISSKEIPTDLGLLPGLFIFPEANGVAPKWLSKNGFKRLKLELFYLRDQARSFAALWMELRWNRKQKPKIPLSVRSRIPIALELHKGMYTALSAKNTALLSRICCNTLAVKLREQVERRSRSTAATLDPQWTLEKYNGLPGLPPTVQSERGWLRRILWWQFPLSSLWAYLVPGVRTKVVSDRAASVPLGEDTVVRQVVVRIRSRQSLIRLKPSPRSTRESTIEGQEQTEKKIQDLTEYVVIQQLILDGRERPWMIWGTVQETDEKGVEALLAKGWSGMGEELTGVGSLVDRAKMMI